MFDESPDDDDLFSGGSVNLSVPVTAVAGADDDVMGLINTLAGSGDFTIDIMSHDAIDASASTGVVLFSVRMMEAFEDLGLIRNWRQQRPLQPIIALCSNDDEDFVLEAFKAGVTNYLSSSVTAAVMSEMLRSYYKMSEAPRLVEIQNTEMLRSMQAERLATEAKMQAEGARQMAEAQAKANERTREILDSLTEGFFTVDAQLVIGDVISKSCVKLFGHAIASQALGDVLELEEGKETYLRGCLEQLFEDFMPLEVNLSLLPKRLVTKDARTLSFSYTPVLSATGAPEKVIIAALDITAEVLTQKSFERLQARSEALFRILTDRDSFKDFLIDSKSDLSALSETTSTVTGKRVLHTLKGNSAVMGLSDVAELIHGMETRLEEEPETCGETYFAECAQGINAGFAQFLTENAKILQMDWDHTDSQVSLPDSDIDQLLAFVSEAEGAGKEEALHILSATKLRSVKSMLSGFGEIAGKIGEKLGKDIRFKVVGEEMKLDPVRYAPLMKSLIHALRNSCDHGIETIEERETLGKNPSGLITFKFERDVANLLKITLSDSGRGIPVQKILKKALDLGVVDDAKIAQMTVKDALHLIFDDGFSTADEISETSGRGVGMSVIKYEVENLGGLIRIATKANKGTVFELLIPE